MAPEGMTPGAPEETATASSTPVAFITRGLTSITARWVAILGGSLAMTLFVSVGAAVRAPDDPWSRAEARSVSYAALGGMQEVNFETEISYVDAPPPRRAAPAWTPLPTPTSSGTLEPRPSPRPTTPSPEPSDDPVDEEEEPPVEPDEGEELGSPDPLTVSASADRSVARQGDAIIYAFAVKNVSGVAIENIVAEMHIPSGTYAAGSCSGLVDEGTAQAPFCADVPGLPATGSDDHHVLKVIGTLQPGHQVSWTLKVRVGADTLDGATILNHGGARAGGIVIPSDDVVVLVI